MLAIAPKQQCQPHNVPSTTYPVLPCYPSWPTNAPSPLHAPDSIISFHFAGPRCSLPPPHLHCIQPVHDECPVSQGVGHPAPQQARAKASGSAVQQVQQGAGVGPLNWRGRVEGRGKSCGGTRRGDILCLLPKQGSSSLRGYTERQTIKRDPNQLTAPSRLPASFRPSPDAS